jgi:hypothetical protein
MNKLRWRMLAPCGLLAADNRQLEASVSDSSQQQQRWRRGEATKIKPHGEPRAPAKTLFWRPPNSNSDGDAEKQLQYKNNTADLSRRQGRSSGAGEAYEISTTSK